MFKLHVASLLHAFGIDAIGEGLYLGHEIVFDTEDTELVTTRETELVLIR